jgi:2-polyprenyl-6-methoxyphenol hydroxylase-like FAD-dependent oxidoreductase
MTNAPALECLRDLDPTVYDECLRLGNAGEFIAHYRWCETLVGVEYARSRAWGTGERSGEYEAVSPCKYIDLPQSLLEPVLLKWATGRGWGVRFDTRLEGFVEDEGGIVASVVDQITGLEYKIKTKYLFGADGGRSSVARILELPFTSIPGGGFAYNVLLRADLTDWMRHREGNLHVSLRIDKDYPFLVVMRAVKPWTEWMFVCLPKGPDAPNPKRSFEEWAVIAKDHIGVENVDVEILDVSGWQINETSADVISKGNV